MNKRTETPEEELVRVRDRIAELEGTIELLEKQRGDLLMKGLLDAAARERGSR